ncbi:MAG: 5-(carboxyamino)imidazole ribonucleotide synthase [Bacteroidetes bacterium]|jgi:5-(carboxyamino)imidazole ribonucleotide synthase|nr:5-(carboxyamino)imidazole ribonucleotide synthase [Bacteroidota bacterium]
MKAIASGDLTLGILGGGQLGKMLIEAASNWNIQCHVLDPDAECSCAHMAHTFVQGSFKDYDTVYNFGKNLQKITIEIEHVNVEALIQLEKEGKTIYPKPAVLQIIQDKGKQKSFYATNDLPTAPFTLLSNLQEVLAGIQNGTITYPFVQKSCTAGYDGKGVAVIRNANDLPKLLEGACVIEQLIDFEKELAVIVARDVDGKTTCFPAVEMEFHPVANLVEFLLAPAIISEQAAAKAQKIAEDCITAFGLTGILAVEMFLTKSGEILINEVAPRPHNSGHHTIEANYVSQYEQLLRTIFEIPMGDTTPRDHGVMVNILGEDGYTGEALYEGLKECLAIPGVFVHLYGKKITKPFRKMGHVTIVGKDANAIKATAKLVKEQLKVIA